MGQKLVRVFIVIFGVMAFVSQTLASTVVNPCNNHTNHVVDGMEHNMSATVHHNHHAQHAMAMSDTKTMPCCDHDQCDSNQCLATASAGIAAISGYAPSAIQISSQSYSDYNFSHQTPDSPGLFRPPISR